MFSFAHGNYHCALAEHGSVGLVRGFFVFSSPSVLQSSCMLMQPRYTESERATESTEERRQSSIGFLREIEDERQIKGQS